MTEFDGNPHRIRVRYCETDRMGVAHHGSYVAWFEEARTEWMRQRGTSYRQMEDGGNLLQVVELVVRYHQTVTYDDVVAVRVALRERSKVSITLDYEVRVDATGEVCGTGSTRLACVGRDGRLRRLPAGI